MVAGSLLTLVMPVSGCPEAHGTGWIVIDLCSPWDGRHPVMMCLGHALQQLTLRYQMFWGWWELAQVLLPLLGPCAPSPTS